MYLILPGAPLSDEEVAELVKEFDADKSGTIGLNELHAFLRFYDPSSQKIRRKTALWHNSRGRRSSDNHQENPKQEMN